MRIQPKTILSAIDFSTFTDTVFSYSVALAKQYDAKLFLVHVTTDLKTLLEHNETALDVEALQKSNIRSAQERLEDRAKDLPIKKGIIISQGTPADMISRLEVNAKESINCAPGWKRNSPVWFRKRAVTGVPPKASCSMGNPTSR